MQLDRLTSHPRARLAIRTTRVRSFQRTGRPTNTSGVNPRVILVDQSVDEDGRVIREGSENHCWFDVSTLRGSYRAEGKKAMGLEVAEQLGWRVLDTIV